MKKRLLSAALALALVLTMLPLAALPAFAADVADGTTLYYFAYGATLTNAEEPGTADAAGWYQRTAGSTNGKFIYEQVTSGVVATTGKSNAAYYQSIEKALEANKSALTLLGASESLDLTKAPANLTIDTFGNNLTISGALEQNNATAASNTKLTTLTLTNTDTSKTVTISSSDIKVTNQTFTLNLTNIDASSIKVESTNSTNKSCNLTVNLTNSKLGNVDLKLEDPSASGNLYVYPKGNSTVGAVTLTNVVTSTKSNNLTLTTTGADNSVGAISAYNAKALVTATSGATTIDSITSQKASGSTKESSPYTGATINLAARSTVTGAVTICGTGTLNMSGMSTVGSVSLFGAKEGSNPTSTAIPNWKTTITVDATSKINGAIEQVAGDRNGHTVNIKNGSSVQSIDLSKGDNSDSSITVSDSTISGAVSVARGSLKITNSKVGDITAGAANVKSSVKIDIGTSAGTDTSSVGTINATAVTDGTAPTLTVYGNASVSTIGTDVVKNIYGGTFANSNTIDKNDLKGGLANGYQIDNSSTYTYTTKFQDLIDAYAAAAENSKPTATLVSDSGAENDKVEVTFKWTKDGKNDTLVVLKVTKGVFIDLPSSVNNTAVNYWYDATNANGEGLPVSSRYMVADTIILAAQITDKTDKVVTGVKATDNLSTSTTDPITATLSGTNINLSGAVNTVGGAGSILITFEVNGQYGDAKVNAGWDSKTGTIQLVAVTGAEDITLPTLRSNEVKVYDTIYTVTGTGLKEIVSNVQVASDLTEVPIVVSGTSAGMSGAYVELGKNVKTAFEGTNSKVDFSKAEGLKAALNSIIANLTESSKESKLNSARSAMAAADKKLNPTQYKDAKASDYMNYNTLVLTPYLEISSSNPTLPGNGQNTMLTLTITLRARYTVTDGGSNVAYKEFGSDGKPSAYWEEAVTLTAPDDCGPVEITLDLTSLSPITFTENTPSYVHHAGRVYTVDFGKKEAIKNENGFNNKTFVINNTAPVAVISTDDKGDNVVGSYESLQDAVNAVNHGEYITVNENFIGAINVTGAARKFTIKATDGKTVNITGVNGANTTYEFDSSSNKYEIQLTASTTTNGTASIRLGSYTNGTASLSTTNAAQGATVTVTTSPNTGYRSLTPTVTANTGSVSVSGSNGTYTFTVPSGATTVTVTPSFVQSNLPFTDVDETAWYYDGVAYCYNTYAGDSRLMEGVDDNRFGINSYMTRAEVVTVMWRLSGSPVETARVTFSDVSSHWAYNAITWAANHGYVDGYENGTFQPNRNISRQELAQMLWKYAGRLNVSANLASYPDASSVSSWAQSAMQWAAGTGILSGRSSVALTRLDAAATAYRSELAVTIMKYHQYYG